MQPTRPRLVPLLCWSALWLPVVAIHAQVSDRMRTQIVATLPKYDPRAAEATPARAIIGTPAPLDDGPMVHLPDFEVVVRRAPGNDPDNWLNHEGLQKKAFKEFRDSMNSLEWALNRWYVPLPFGFSLTPAPQARADADYADKKIATEVKRLSEVVNAVAHLDPAAAKQLARELDLDLHPAN
jgi:hypothetical protein